MALPKPRPLYPTHCPHCLCQGTLLLDLCFGWGLDNGRLCQEVFGWEEREAGDFVALPCSGSPLMRGSPSFEASRFLSSISSVPSPAFSSTGWASLPAVADSRVPRCARYPGPDFPESETCTQGSPPSPPKLHLVTVES